MIMKALNTHIAITLRVEWLSYEPDGAYIRDCKTPKPTDLFLSTHQASRDEQYLWGYFGDYAHSHLGLGWRGNLPLRNLTKKEWKESYSKMRKEENRYTAWGDNQLSE